MGREAVWFASLTARGTPEGIEGLDATRSIAGVTEVKLLADPGAKLTGLNSSKSRLALIRASADDAETAIQLARSAIKLFNST